MGLLKTASSINEWGKMGREQRTELLVLVIRSWMACLCGFDVTVGPEVSHPTGSLHDILLVRDI